MSKKNNKISRIFYCRRTDLKLFYSKKDGFFFIVTRYKRTIKSQSICALRLIDNEKEVPEPIIHNGRTNGKNLIDVRAVMEIQKMKASIEITQEEENQLKNKIGFEEKLELEIEAYEEKEKSIKKKYAKNKAKKTEIQENNLFNKKE